jgi:hypothetical protein
MSDEVATVKWSGEVMGMRVHVLSDGRRIIDAEDLDRFFGRLVTGKNEDGSNFDVDGFAAAFGRFMNGSTESESEGT